MSLVVFSKSGSFENHLRSMLGDDVQFRHKLTPPVSATSMVFIVHESSFNDELQGWLASCAEKGINVAIAADAPDVEGMLAYTDLGVKAYLNAYMADIHYSQLVRLLENGQSWFPPTLLGEAFNLARKAVRRADKSDPLESLTQREKEIAFAVSEGKSNRVIADGFNISERTVKTHLTNIFKKLQVKDRVALVIYMNQGNEQKPSAPTMH